MTDVDWTHRMEEAAEAHINAVVDAWFGVLNGEDVDTPSPPSEPYCGCVSCDVREILAGAWPVIQDMLAEERRITWQLAAVTGRYAARVPTQRGALVPLGAHQAAVALGAQETSVEAAALTLGASDSHRYAVVKTLSQAPNGMTDDELEVAIGLRHQTVSARRRGLVQDGWIHEARDEDGQTIKRRTRTGANALVWVLTPDGLNQWSQQ